jgi:hypothetical protein
MARFHGCKVLASESGVYRVAGYLGVRAEMRGARSGRGNMWSNKQFALRRAIAQAIATHILVTDTAHIFFQAQPSPDSLHM